MAAFPSGAFVEELSPYLTEFIPLPETESVLGCNPDEDMKCYYHDNDCSESPLTGGFPVILTPTAHGGPAIVPATLTTHSPVLETDRRERLEAYSNRFAGVFARADQLRWFRVYVQGLLAGMKRKNVESIAAGARADELGEPNFAQALQHFISHSPWDANRLMAVYRARLPTSATAGPLVWVVHDGVIPKKGQHSVGTQRQYARSMGRKLNCQLAVVVGVSGPGGYFPLAIRLYLPAYWLRERPVAVEKTVPEEFRTHVGKAELALSIIDELAAEGWAAGPVVADESFAGVEAFHDGLEKRSRRIVASSLALRDATNTFEKLKVSLGLEHFEGRTWQGWHHHAALVLAAYGFLASESDELPE